MWMGVASRAGVNALIAAIDPWHDPRPGSRDDPFDLKTGDAVYAEFMANRHRFGLDNQILPVRGYSADVAMGWDAPIGLLFVDAVHTEEAVLADVAAWLPYMHPGSLLALHDYDTNPDAAYYGVSVAAERLVESGDFRFIKTTDHSLWFAERT